MSPNSIAVLLLSAAVAACAPAVTIVRDAAHPIHPNATYAWGAADGARSAAERDPTLVTDSVRGRIERAIDAELAAKGFRKVAFSDADLIVHYHIGMERKVDTVRTASPCGPKPCADAQMEWGYWGSPEQQNREVAYAEGSLMVDVLARPSLTVAWRGTIAGEVRANSSSDEHIRKGVARLLAKFPER